VCRSSGSSVYSSCKLCQRGGCWDDVVRIYEYCDNNNRGDNINTGKCVVSTAYY